jgi:hypothetical protein
MRWQGILYFIPAVIPISLHYRQAKEFLSGSK